MNEETRRGFEAAGQDDSSGGETPSTPRRRRERREARSGFEASLLEGSPRDVLRGLCDGDPLGMAERCARHLRRRGLILDLARLVPLALARAAHDAPQRDPRADLEAFLERSVARATRQLLRRELEEERAALAHTDGDDPHLARLVELLDLEPALARLAMLHLNSLPRPVRLAFRALFLDGESPAEHAARAGTTVPRVLGHARLALRVVAGCGRVDARDARAWGRALTSDGEEAYRG